METYYRPSGKFNPLSILIFVGLCLTAFPLLGLIYAYAIWYIPFIYINFLIAAGFGFIIGLLINFLVVRKGKVRNTALAITFGVLGGLIGLYFHWAVWVDLVINAGESYGTSRIGITSSNIKILEVFSLAADPGALFALIGEINEFGTWGIRSATVSGTFLTIIWIVELLIVTVVSTLVPMGGSGAPFCEVNNKWFEEKELPPLSLVENVSQLIKDIGAKNEAAFDNLTKATDLEKDHSVFTLYTAGKDENYLSIENKKAEINKKGETELNGDEFATYILVNNILKEKLLSR